MASDDKTEALGGLESDSTACARDFCPEKGGKGGGSQPNDSI